MPIAASLLPTTCDIIRPFGSGIPVALGVKCRLVADFARSRRSTQNIRWTHYLVVNNDVDIKDGITRLFGDNNLSYLDGDEVIIPSGATAPRFVVVWVERVETGTSREYLRAFLMRHEA